MIELQCVKIMMIKRPIAALLNCLPLPHCCLPLTVSTSHVCLNTRYLHLARQSPLHTPRDSRVGRMSQSFLSHDYYLRHDPGRLVDIWRKVHATGNADKIFRFIPSKMAHDVAYYSAADLQVLVRTGFSEFLLDALLDAKLYRASLQRANEERPRYNRNGSMNISRRQYIASVLS